MAGPVDCVDQLVADLSSAPIPEPTEIVVVEGLNVHVNTAGVNAFSLHVRNAAIAFADCATPDPNQVLPCVLAVTDDIVRNIFWQQIGEVDLRYVHVHDGGVSVYGETAVADASAIAACL